MKGPLKRLFLTFSPVLDILAAPFVLAGALFLKLIRTFGIARLNLCRRIFWAVGMVPVTNHYYEPFLRKSEINHPLEEDRHLPGIDLNPQGQLETIRCFHYNDELVNIPMRPGTALEFYYDNPAFLSGDAEFLYNMVRYFKPRKLVEVGSGFSTLMAFKAMKANREEDASYPGEIICIEPFEHSWLESIDVTVTRELVQTMDIELFLTLTKDDILFIDSSHITKPQNDVLFLYHRVLPVLNPGVLVHVHDIFTPKDYLEEWVFNDIRFWNEQYMLEAFLSLNNQFQVVAALNFLLHHYPDELLSVCPILAEQVEYREPGSFWIRRTT